jgi:hypothetical protein
MLSDLVKKQRQCCPWSNKKPRRKDEGGRRKRDERVEKNKGAIRRRSEGSGKDVGRVLEGWHHCWCYSRREPPYYAYNPGGAP